MKEEITREVKMAENFPLNEEECQKRRLGLEQMLLHGEEKIQARFQTSIVAKIIQSELIEIAIRANHSLQNILKRVRGDTIGSSAYQGGCRAKLVVHAISSLHGSSFDLVNSLIVVTLRQDRDQFFIDLITGEDILESNVIKIMHQEELISDEVYQILTDDLDIQSNFQVGDFIVNLSEKINWNMSATERLIARRESFCRSVTEKLPLDVNLAEVTRVDDLDGTLRWRDANDHARGGWVEIQAVIKAATTRKSTLKTEKKSEVL